ncbi:MAG: hypothetical protein ABIU09_09505 [Pyrinomonadaceae bacterium]
MKKFLVFSLMVGAMAFVVPSAEAKTAAASVTADPQTVFRSGKTVVTIDTSAVFVPLRAHE